MARVSHIDSFDGKSRRSTDSGHPAESVDEDLVEQLQRVKEELKGKENDVKRARDLSERADRAIEDLTGSLFESAHAMVERAKHAQANAENQLEVSQKAIEHFTAENSQLKRTIHELKTILDSCRSSSLVSSLSGHLVDPVLCREYTCWEEKPSLDRDGSLFMYRIYEEDIFPCLTFPNTELSKRVLRAIEENEVMMESDPSEEKRICSLIGERYPCPYRIQFGEEQQWYPLSSLARNRIVAVCEFFTFLRHVQRGLVKSDAQCRLERISQLRRQMVCARLGI